MKPKQKQPVETVGSYIDASKPSKKPSTSRFIFKNSRFSTRQLTIFCVCFGIIGGFILYKTFAAAPVVATVEAETMTAASTIALGPPSTLGASTTVYSTVPASTIAKKIDGNLNESDWSISEPITKSVIGTSNNSAMFGTLWDSKYLYVGAKIKDSALKKDSRYVWEDDSVEVYLDPTANGGTTYDSQDRQFTKGWNRRSVSEIGGHTAGVLHGWAKISGGYSVELAIPWTNLGITPSAGKDIRFDIGYNDDDNGGNRESQAMWKGSDINYKDPSAFAPLILASSQTPAPTPTPAPSPSPTPNPAPSPSPTPTPTPPPTPAPTPATEILSDATASGGKVLALNSNATVTSTFTTTATAATVTVKAKGVVCSGVGSNMVLSVDGKQISTPSVSATSWTDYTAAANIAAGSHVLGISFTNDANDGTCNRNLYLDKTDFYGVEPPAPLPTVTLSASPTVVDAGQKSTLAWSSTNATSCSASGAWSGTKSLSGSESTAALSTSSTYSLTCTGAGGSKTVSTTITINAISANSFSGSYFNSTDLSGSPVFSRNDPAIDFNWDQASPDASVNTDGFSARWVGNFNFDAANYTFTATVDDGVRVYVDNVLIMEQWFRQSPTTYTAAKTMTAGVHNVKVEYYEEVGGASIAFSWVKTTTTPTPPPTPPTPPPSSNSGMIVGLNHNSGWGLDTVADEATAVKYNRLETSTGSQVSDYYSKGIRTIVLISGTCADCNYSTSGVSSINASAFASSAISYYQSQCKSSTDICPAVEVLNEPAGDWFWGANASSSANSSAYANLLVTTYNAFHSQFGSASPKLLGSYDGGYAGDNSWGQHVYAANSNIGNYVDGWTVHPYGGCGSSTSAQGNRSQVTAAHNATGKPIWATEIGWPTATGQPCTGDSSQWSESQQADNIYNFIQWSRSTGYVDGVLIFAYHDYGSNAWYGVVRTDGSKKPSFNALKCAAQNQPQQC